MTHLNGKTRETRQIQLTLMGEAEIIRDLRKETQPPTRPLVEGGLRMYYQNVNGIKAKNSEWEDMLKSLSENQVGVFGFAETNFQWTPIATKICVNKARSALKRHHGKKVDLTLQTSACCGWNGSQYQPGGTCTGALGQWASRIASREEDPDRLGRWSCLRIQIKGTVISIITAYRVCKTKVNLETNTAYAQQWKELTAKSSKKVNPREKTLTDLKKYVKKEIEKKREVVLMMDANESLENRSDEMSALIQECGLVDSHLLDDPYSEVETYSRQRENRLRTSHSKNPTLCEILPHSTIQRMDTIRPQSPNRRHRLPTPLKGAN